jgi:ABC-type lipoprotein release transport system permease subunit
MCHPPNFLDVDQAFLSAVILTIIVGFITFFFCLSMKNSFRQGTGRILTLLPKHLEITKIRGQDAPQGTLPPKRESWYKKVVAR